MTAGAHGLLGARRPSAEHPISLGVLRIVVCALVLTSAEVTTDLAVSLPDPALWAPPEGLQTVARLAPITGGFVEMARATVIVAGALGLVGLATRFAMPCLAIAATVLFAVPQLASAPRHNMHLLWFLWILAVCPCGAALSVDARRGHAPVAHPLAVTVPIWTARALLACIYFFPGFWKLAESGLAWITSDNLTYQMYWKWYQNGFIPALRVDRQPWLVRTGAAAVVCFELGFPLLLWSRRTRVAAAALGLGFHLMADAFLLLPYSSLWWCYVVLIDWKWVTDWLYDVPRQERGASTPLDLAAGRSKDFVWLAAGASLIVTGAVVQGARNAMLAWPFACYPTFQWMARPTMPDLLVVAVDALGKETPLAEGPARAEPRSQRRWALAWRAAGAMGHTDVERLRAYYEMARRESPRMSAPTGTRALRFYRAEYAVAPERWGEPPVRRTLLGEVAL
jgi:hypothetical protein